MKCRYEHTQRGKLHYIVAGAFAAWAGAMVATQGGTSWRLSTGLLAGVFALAAVIFWLTFQNLTVRDMGEFLAVEFGPLAVFRKQIPYAEVTEVGRERSGFLDAWGIHYAPGKGWIYNLWGFDCVKVTLRDRKAIRIGTDDAGTLERFLKEAAGIENGD